MPPKNRKGSKKGGGSGGVDSIPATSGGQFGSIVSERMCTCHNRSTKLCAACEAATGRYRPTLVVADLPGFASFSREFLTISGSKVVEALNNIACVHCKNAALSEWTRIVDGEHETDKLAVKLHGAPVTVTKQKGKVVVAASSDALEVVLRSKLASHADNLENGIELPEITPPPSKPAVSAGRLAAATYGYTSGFFEYDLLGKVHTENGILGCDDTDLPSTYAADIGAAVDDCARYGRATSSLEKCDSFVFSRMEFNIRNYAMHPPALMATWGQIETFENTFLNLYRRLSLPGLMLRGFLAYIEAQNGHIYGLSPPADSAKKGSKPTEVESRPSMTPFTADGPQLRSMYRRLDGLEAALSSGLDLFVNKFEKETGVLLGSLPRASLFTNVSFTDSDISASVGDAYGTPTLTCPEIDTIVEAERTWRGQAFSQRRENHKEMNGPINAVSVKCQDFSSSEGITALVSLRERFVNEYMGFVMQCKRLGGGYLGNTSRVEDSVVGTHFGGVHDWDPSASAPLLGGAFHDSAYFDSIEAEMIKPLLMEDSDDDKPKAGKASLSRANADGKSAASVSASMTPEARVVFFGSEAVTVRERAIAAMDDVTRCPVQGALTARKENSLLLMRRLGLWLDALEMMEKSICSDTLEAPRSSVACTPSEIAQLQHLTKVVLPLLCGDAHRSAAKAVRASLEFKELPQGDKAHVSSAALEALSCKAAVLASDHLRALYMRTALSNQLVVKQFRLACEAVKALDWYHSTLLRVWHGACKILMEAASRGRKLCGDVEHAGASRVQRVLEAEFDEILAEKAMEWETNAPERKAAAKKAHKKSQQPKPSAPAVPVVDKPVIAASLAPDSAREPEQPSGKVTQNHTGVADAPTAPAEALPNVAEDVAGFEEVSHGRRALKKGNGNVDAPKHHQPKTKPPLANGLHVASAAKPASASLKPPSAPVITSSAPVSRRSAAVSSQTVAGTRDVVTVVPTHATTIPVDTSSMLSTQPTQSVVPSGNPSPSIVHHPIVSVVPPCPDPDAAVIPVPAPAIAAAPAPVTAPAPSPAPTIAVPKREPGEKKKEETSQKPDPPIVVKLSPSQPSSTEAVVPSTTASKSTAPPSAVGTQPHTTTPTVVLSSKPVLSSQTKASQSDTSGPKLSANAHEFSPGADLPPVPHQPHVPLPPPETPPVPVAVRQPPSLLEEQLQQPQQYFQPPVMSFGVYPAGFPLPSSMMMPQYPQGFGYPPMYPVMMPYGVPPHMGMVPVGYYPPPQHMMGFPAVPPPSDVYGAQEAEDQYGSQDGDDEGDLTSSGDDLDPSPPHDSDQHSEHETSSGEQSVVSVVAQSSSVTGSSVDVPVVSTAPPQSAPAVSSEEVTSVSAGSASVSETAHQTASVATASEVETAPAPAMKPENPWFKKKALASSVPAAVPPVVSSPTPVAPSICPPVQPSTTAAPIVEGASSAEWHTQARRRKGDGVGDLSLAQGGQAMMGAVTGLENRYGDNNCFLNAIVQQLSRLAPFRARLNASSKHSCVSQRECVICALRELLARMDTAGFGTKVSLSGLRAALHATIAARDGAGAANFRKAVMSDAAEALEDILTLIHSVEAKIQASKVRSRGGAVTISDAYYVLDPASVPATSVALGTFGIVTEVRPVCDKCGHCGSSWREVGLAMHVNTTLLVGMKSLGAFDARLHALAAQDPRSCPKCRGSMHATRRLMQDVQVFTIVLGWASPSPPQSMISSVASCVDPIIDLAAIYDEMHGVKTGVSYPFRLRGITCYTRRHYVSLFDEFPSESSQRWTCCDDVKVFGVGNPWERCASQGLVPLVLCYESLGIDSPCPPAKGRSLTVLADHVKSASGPSAVASISSAAAPAPAVVDSVTQFPSLAATVPRRK